MSIKILTKNSIDNTNIDGARQNHFSAGMRSGIVKGAFNEGRFFASASNEIALDSCELRISGHQIVIDGIEAITLNDRPSVPTKYSMIAEIQVSDMSVPSFRLFIQPASVGLRQENLFKTNNGSGIYQLRIGNFTLGTTGLISDVVRTADIITGGGEGGVADIKFNATATQLSSSSQPTANIDYNEETKEYDAHFGIPAGSGTDVTIGGVVQPTWSADFAESERQKSKNLFDINNVKEYIGNISTYVNGNEITISNSTGWGQLSYSIDVKPNTDYVLSVQDINVITQSTGSGKVGIYRGSNNSYLTEIEPIERERTFNSGDETQIIVYLTSTAWGVEGSGKVKYIGIQIEEGTVATDYQPYNGAITHNGDASVVFAENERLKTKNLLVYPYTGEVYQYGVTFTDNGDGSFTINGKQTDTTANSYHYMETADTFKLSTGTYTLKAFADTSVTGWNLVLYDGEYYHEVSSSNITRTITLNEDKACSVYIQVPKASTTTFNNFVVKPILVKGTEVGEWQPYNGATVHEKQLKETVEKRELFYDVLNNRIDITNSTLTTLQAYFDLFKSDTNKIYTCNIGALETSKFKDLLPSVEMGNYCSCYIKHYSNGLWENGRLEAFEIVTFEQFGQNFAKGYLYKNLNSTIVFTGWTKIGG